jgi:lipopolysaccharide transport system ATP-binding protein
MELLMNTENISIEVKNISKLYRLGSKDVVHDSFVNALVDFLKAPLINLRYYKSLYTFEDLDLSRKDALANLPHDVICAVNDVSFTVKSGEVLGIIGSNGAGKSTLLKILSRITYPTKGRIESKGKISSLLEVGTGFHPELTGRENIYLNGTILGMRKKEIDSKFDEIVDFSGIEKFLDTPVKRYSSGMKVRLAFSVAAHLDPDILIVDEVLAVGDAEFQKKCLGRMSRLASGEKTVLFVSHDMRAIAKLCTRVLLLEDGCIKKSGNPLEIIESYLSSEIAPSFKWFAPASENNDQELKILSAEVLAGDSQPIEIVTYNSGFNVGITYEVKQAIKNGAIFLRLTDQMGNDIWTSWDTDKSNAMNNIRYPGTYTSICKIPPFIMRPGRYKVQVGAMVPGVKLIEGYTDAITLDITDIGYPLNKQRIGVITPLFEWEVKDSGRNHHKRTG